jgi:FkbM family methyltransferase
MHLNNCSNIIFHRVALGDKHQIVEMNRSNSSNEGNTSVGFGGDTVEMQRLDDLRLTNVSLIKIDVEGYEDQVIEGALETILSQKPVLIVEIWSDSELGKKINKIEQLGYRAFNLSGVHDYLFIPICLQ